MPIYEYQCQSCEHQFEALQKISDPPLTDCPACSSPSLKKLVTAAAFKLKGSGWYETDFKNKGAANAKASKDKASGEKPAAASSDAGSSGGSASTGSKATPDSGAKAASS